MFEIWPENLEALQLFFALDTQWRWVALGLGGARRTGLIYSEARGEMRERGIALDRRNALLEDLRVMERAALAAMYGTDGEG